MCFSDSLFIVENRAVQNFLIVGTRIHSLLVVKSTPSSLALSAMRLTDSIKHIHLVYSSNVNVLL